MMFLVAIVVLDLILLAGTVISARRRPSRFHRSDGFPHAL